MSNNALPVGNTACLSAEKLKPRYTEAENETLFATWWNPLKRRELSRELGRDINALRSQFCRLLKEKGLTSEEYYNKMQSKYSRRTGSTPRKRNRNLKEVDQLILDTFCKHQALGNSRSRACDELLVRLGPEYTPAALKLRFYRLVKLLQYEDTDLLRLGQEALKNLEHSNASGTSFENTYNHWIPSIQSPVNNVSFIEQLAFLPAKITLHEERLGKIEEQQRHQLDLRGFIEHLLALERDIKREDKLLEEIQKLIEENDNVHSIMDKEREKLNKREEELISVYKMLEMMLNDFMHLESVPKLTSLGELKNRLEITVDQFGSVLKSKRILS